ncbi:MAG: hypothetical protein AAFV53_27170, partial [Myxococcota bacterium]
MIRLFLPFSVTALALVGCDSDGDGETNGISDDDLARIDALEAALGDAEQSIAALQQTVSDHQATIDALTATVNDTTDFDA